MSLLSKGTHHYSFPQESFAIIYLFLCIEPIFLILQLCSKIFLPLKTLTSC
uniref:Uncharacterized protein n=1 Tax=Kalanchoe fedtschenkoi TaxID=63787 RepID=A0A7N0U8B1_KALFE